MCYSRSVFNPANSAGAGMKTHHSPFQIALKPACSAQSTHVLAQALQELQPGGRRCSLANTGSEQSLAVSLGLGEDVSPAQHPAFQAAGTASGSHRGPDAVRQSRHASATARNAGTEQHGPQTRSRFPNPPSSR